MIWDKNIRENRKVIPAKFICSLLVLITRNIHLFTVIISKNTTSKTTIYLTSDEVNIESGI